MALVCGLTFGVGRSWFVLSGLGLSWPILGAMLADLGGGYVGPSLRFGVGGSAFVIGWSVAQVAGWGFGIWVVDCCDSGSYFAVWGRWVGCDSVLAVLVVVLLLLY